LFHTDIALLVHITIDKYLLSIVMDRRTEIGDSGAPDGRQRQQPGLRSTKSAHVSRTKEPP